MKNGLKIHLFILLSFICVFLIKICSESIIVKSDSEVSFNESELDVQKNIFKNKIIDKSFYLYNLDDSPDYVCILFAESGYVIMSSSTLEVVEYSIYDEFPYRENQQNYYAGPMNYFIKENESFKNIISGDAISVDEANKLLSYSREKVLKINNTSNRNKKRKSINKTIDITNLDKIKRVINNISSSAIDKSIVLMKSGDASIPGDGHGRGIQYIENYEYFLMGPCHGKNITGTCCAVAAQLIMSYNNYYNDRQLIDNTYLFEGEDNPNCCSNPMNMNSRIIGTNGVNEYGSISSDYFSKVVSVIPASSTVFEISNGLESLINERENILGLNYDLATISWGLSTSVIKDEIDAGRPVIISINTESSGHAVVGYGYQYLFGSGSLYDSQFGFVTHFGWANEGNWQEHTNVWVSSLWCESYVKMVTSHMHSYDEPQGVYYERKCSCGHRISDYPFLTTIVSGGVEIVSANFPLPNYLIIPSSINGLPVVSIASNAFLNKTSLEIVKIPKCIETIKSNAFKGCSNIKEIILPFVGEERNAINQNGNLGYIFSDSYFSGSHASTSYGSTFFIPDSLERITITDAEHIQPFAFNNCKVKHIILSYGLLDIGDRAFYNCDNIDSVNLPRSLMNIGNQVFLGCDKLNNLIIPYNVQNIGTDCFENNLSVEWVYNPNYTASDLNIDEVLMKVTFGSGVSAITSGAFVDCYNLKKIEIPEFITSIANDAFQEDITDFELLWHYNSNYTAGEIGTQFRELLTDVEVSHGVTSIKAEAFKNCENLKNVRINQDLLNTGVDAFLGCSSLEKVEFIYGGVFAPIEVGVSNVVTKITIPNTTSSNDIIDNVTPIICQGCSRLTDISISDSVTNIYYINNGVIVYAVLGFVPSQVRINLSIPSSFLDEDVVTIGSLAFNNIDNIGSINIPEGVLYLGDGVFNGCDGLTDVVLPNSLISIGNQAFYHCSALRNVIIEKEAGDIINLGQNAFDGCNDLVIVVPQNRICEYKNAYRWSEYKDSIISLNNVFDKITVDCYTDNSLLVHLDAGICKIYELNVYCGKSYNFIASYDLIINIYDSNMYLVYSDTGSLTGFLSPGVYYIDFRYNNNYSYGAINIAIHTTWPCHGYEVVKGINNNVLTHLHKIDDDEFESRLFFDNVYESNFYMFKISGVMNDLSTICFTEDMISIYSDNMRIELLNKYTHGDYQNHAKSKEGEDSIIAYLNANRLFYIVIKLNTNTFSSLSLEISDVNDSELNLFELNETTNTSINLISDSVNNDNIKQVTLNQTGKFDINIQFNGRNSEQILFVVLKKVYDSIIHKYVLNEICYYLFSDSVNSIIATKTLQPGIYYIGYFNKHGDASISITLNRLITDSGSGVLLVDPGSDWYCGSEINIIERFLTNKSYNNTFITEGFTRIIYINIHYGLSDSRLDYYWYSSDEEKATVTDYGTVLGRSAGIVKIMAVLKTDASKAFVKTFNIIEDDGTGYQNIESNYNVSLSDTLNGRFHLELENVLCPYPIHQYYTWNISNVSSGLIVSEEEWGDYSVSDVGTFDLVGTNYIYNTIFITIVITIHVTVT